MFIDQLAMIQEKTRGNLTNEEAAVLRNTLSNLQMAFVEVSQQSGDESRPASPEPVASASASESPAEESSTSAAAEPNALPATPQGDSESRKKFTKSYGA